jgi:hypothetical protein
MVKRSLTTPQATPDCAIGALLRRRFAEHFAAAGIAASIRFIDRSYAIRGVPANPYDSVYRVRLAQAAVHAAMSVRTEMVVGRRWRRVSCTSQWRWPSASATRWTHTVISGCRSRKPPGSQRDSENDKRRCQRARRTSWPVSRILCTGRLAASRLAIIHLGLPSPAGSSGLPAGIGRATLDRLRSAPEPARLLALLQVGFTEPSRSPGTLVVSYTTVSPLPR